MSIPFVSLAGKRSSIRKEGKCSSPPVRACRSLPGACTRWCGNLSAAGRDCEEQWARRSYRRERNDSCVAAWREGGGGGAEHSLLFLSRHDALLNTAVRRVYRSALFRCKFCFCEPRVSLVGARTRYRVRLRSSSLRRDHRACLCVAYVPSFRCCRVPRLLSRFCLLVSCVANACPCVSVSAVAVASPAGSIREYGFAFGTAFCSFWNQI